MAFLPPTHEWRDLDKRLLFLRFYAEAMDELGDGKRSEADLIKDIMRMEIGYEGNTESHRVAYQELTAKAYGYKFRAPDPPPPPPPDPEMDEETKAVIAKHQVSEKPQQYMKSLSQGAEQSDKAFSTLVRAYINTVLDLSIPLGLEYADQQKKAE